MQSQAPGVPIILVSGTSGSIGEERAVDLLKAGVEDFVAKQHLARLVPAMERALEVRRLHRDKAAAEARLHLLAQVFEQASEGITITDPEANILSLSYLKRLPIDSLKIDQSFVRDIPGDQND